MARTFRCQANYYLLQRYIAICHPLRAKTICTLNRAVKVIIFLWLIALISAVPWLGLTVTKKSLRFPSIEYCDWRVSRHQYSYIFGVDFLLFYVIPLITASVLYLKIGLALHKSTRTSTEQRRSRSLIKSKTTEQANLVHRESNGNATSKMNLGESMRSEAALKARRSRVKVWVMDQSICVEGSFT